MVSLKTSICTTCDNLLECNWSNKHNKMFCSEFHNLQVENGFNNQVVLNTTHKPVAGLCCTCVYKTDCQWNVVGQIKLECEQYE